MKKDKPKITYQIKVIAIACCVTFSAVVATNTTVYAGATLEPVGWETISNMISNLGSSIGDSLSSIIRKLLVINDDDYKKSAIEVDKAMGSAGISNTDILEAITDTAQVKRDLTTYLDNKYILDEDIDLFKLSMILSSMCVPFNENLNNLTSALRTGILTDPSLDKLAGSGTQLSYTITDVIEFIDANYYKMPVYLDTNGTHAYVSDLFDETSAEIFYIKDTGLMLTDASFTTSELNIDSVTTEAMLKEVGNYTTLLMEDSKLLSAMYSVEARDKLVQAALGKTEYYFPVLTKSDAFFAALQMALNEFEYYVSGVTASGVREAFSSHTLGMDTFGNLIDYESGAIIIPGLLNPVFMAQAGNADGFDTAMLDTFIPSNFYGLVHYSECENPYNANSLNLIANSKATADNTISNALKSHLSSILHGDDIIKDGNLQYIYEIEGKPLNCTYVMKDSTGLYDLVNSTGYGTRATVQSDTAYVYVGVGKVNARSHRVGMVKYNGQLSKYTAAIIPSDHFLINNTYFDTQSLNYYKKTWTGLDEYSCKGFIPKTSSGGTIQATLKSAIGASIPSESSTFVQQYQAYTNWAIDELVPLCSLFKDIDDSARMTRAMLQGDNAAGVESDGVVQSGTRYFTKNMPKSYADIEYDQDTLLDHVVILGGFDCTTESTIVTTNFWSCVDGSNFNAPWVVQPLNYNSLLLSIFKNTHAVTELNSIAELSEDTLAEMRSKKLDEIINMVYNQMTNPIRTVFKYIGGFYQGIHSSLSAGTLESLFYITDGFVTDFTETFPSVLFSICVSVLTLRAIVLFFKAAFHKTTLAKALKEFTFSLFFIFVPILLLNAMYSGLGSITDALMQNAVVIFNGAEIRKDLYDAFYEETSGTEKSIEVQYFIENFEIASKNTSTIQEVASDSYLASELRYDEISTKEIIERIKSTLSIQDTNMPYGKSNNAVPAIHSAYYDTGIYYYFLDYFFNEYALYRTKIEGTTLPTGTGAATALMLDMITDEQHYMRDYFNDDTNIYGTGKSLNQRVFKDIGGLKKLFADENMLKYFDTTTVLGSGQVTTSTNYYWEALKSAQLKPVTIEEIDAMGETVEYVYMPYDPEYIETFRKAGISGMPVSLCTSEAEFLTIESDSVVKYKNTTPLESLCWDFQRSFYSDVSSYFIYCGSNTSDMEDLLQVTAIATFNFNRTFGYVDGVFNREYIQPISYTKQNLDFDSLMTSIFVRDDSEYALSGLMYALLLDGYQFPTATVIILSECLLFVFTLMRSLHLILIYLLVTLYVIIRTITGQLSKNGAIGVVAQVAYYFAIHTVLMLIISLLTMQPFRGNALANYLSATILFVCSILVLIFEATMIILICKHWKDLGGAVVASTVTAATASLMGKFQGAFQSEADIENAGDITTESDRLLADLYVQEHGDQNGGTSEVATQLDADAANASNKLLTSGSGVGASSSDSNSDTTPSIMEQFDSDVSNAANKSSSSGSLKNTAVDVISVVKPEAGMALKAAEALQDSNDGGN